jgi:tritrans,polycis-undecaprenyl-diphosphate synthase [geranylgeranyl-diphosphate specific]
MIIPRILKGINMPKHLAIDASLIRPWALKENVDLKEAVKRNIEKILEMIDFQQKKDMPILTIQLSTKNEEEINGLKKLFHRLALDENIHEKKVRVNIIGDWYNSEPELVDSIKALLDKTKDYDEYFLNFALKYKGQEEILTAVKLLLKKAQSSKFSIDNLTIEQLKENLPSSNYIPPEIIIVNSHEYTGLLLWDSVGSLIYFTDKYWLDFERKDLDKAIDFFNRKKELNKDE